MPIAINKDSCFQLKRFIRLTSARKENQKYRLVFGYYPDSTFEVDCNDESFYVLFNLWKPITRQDLYNKVKKIKNGISYDNVDEDLKRLTKTGMLEIYSSKPVTPNRYDRHLIYYSMFSNVSEICQQKLQGSKIVLLGVGGIGSWLAYCLAGSGVGTIIGVDHDVVELTNLTRQILFDENDIGKSKVIQARKRIKKFNSQVKFVPVNKEISDTKCIREIISGTDMVLLSADTPRHIGSMVNEACVLEKIPWSVTGYIDMHGVCGPLIVPGKTACLKCSAGGTDASVDCFSEEQKRMVERFNKRYQAPSYGPFNCFLSGFQAMEAIKYLTEHEVPQTIGARFIINSKNMKTISTKGFRSVQ